MHLNTHNIQSMQLSSLGRLTHERHFNTRKFKRDEMYIPGKET